MLKIISLACFMFFNISAFASQNDLWIWVTEKNIIIHNDKPISIKNLSGIVSKHKSLRGYDAKVILSIHDKLKDYKVIGNIIKSVKETGILKITIVITGPDPK